MSLDSWQSCNRLEIQKEAHKFSAAHMTVFPDGTKETMHGHDYRVAAALEFDDQADSWLEFSFVKKALAELCAAWDDRLLLAERNPHFEKVRVDAKELEFWLCGKRYVLPVDECVLVPVDNILVERLSEELARKFLAKIHARCGDRLRAVEIAVTEGRGQTARFRLVPPEERKL
jgi:6-pyruvoyltetrahydropterin/6-carboxytetrahydropterin synthase